LGHDDVGGVGKAARQAVLSGPCGRSGAASAAGSPGHRRRDRQVGWLREIDPETAVNQELGALFDQDQADRRGELPADLDERDERRRRVEQLLAEGTVVDPDDLFCAAMVFQHGTDRTHFLRAHELAKRAAELGSTRPARWLAAAAYDRWLMTGGLPQKYGTQYRFAKGRWVLHEVDPTTSDEERARWDVPALAEALRRAAQMTCNATPGQSGPQR
jgi:hypothetical protein